MASIHHVNLNGHLNDHLDDRADNVMNTRWTTHALISKQLVLDIYIGRAHMDIVYGGKFADINGMTLAQMYKIY